MNAIRSVRLNNHHVTTHNLLCLIDLLSFDSSGRHPSNDRQHKARYWL